MQTECGGTGSTNSANILLKPKLHNTTKSIIYLLAKLKLQYERRIHVGAIVNLQMTSINCF